MFDEDLTFLTCKSDLGLDSGFSSLDFGLVGLVGLVGLIVGLDEGPVGLGSSYTCPGACWSYLGALISETCWF